MGSTEPCSCCGAPPANCECWRHPVVGTTSHVRDLQITEADRPGPPATQLGQLSATAICGNDITSSCLYVAALAAVYAGPLAPVALLLVAGVLYLFRRIYTEAVTALPLNGGAYNVLLNTTSKKVAALAACLTLLSYVATAVISSSEAVHYVSLLLPGTPVLVATACLLVLFAGLTLLGLTESATVASAIFLFHLVTLGLLLVLGTVAVASDFGTLTENLMTPTENWPTPPLAGLPMALFLGFSAGMLGISGFESSANFVEEQKTGVFPKTLRNMWIAILVLNPSISVLSLGLLTLTEVAENKQALLAQMAHHAVVRLAGPDATWFAEVAEAWVALDAALVLSGAVLTSFVGVTGLMRRLSLDLVLPRVLLRTNRLRDTPHWAIVSFLAACLSIVVITEGRLEVLAGVYTLSFLGVMGLFVLGDGLLGNRHPHLPRLARAPPWTLVVAGGAVLAAIFGNIFVDPESPWIFSAYFAVTMSLVGVMFARVKLSIAVLSLAADTGLQGRWVERLRQIAQARLHAIRCRRLLFVPATGTADELRRAVRYILRHEDLRRVSVVWFGSAEIPSGLERAVADMDAANPTLQLDLSHVDHAFDPAAVLAVARQLDVPRNYIFVAADEGRRIENYRALGGARLIL